MFDKKKFKIAVTLSGYSMEEIANLLGISVPTLYRKINRDGDFRRYEIQILISKLGIKNADQIFFVD